MVQGAFGLWWYGLLLSHPLGPLVALSLDRGHWRSLSEMPDVAGGDAGTSCFSEGGTEPSSTFLKQPPCSACWADLEKGRIFAFLAKVKTVIRGWLCCRYSRIMATPIVDSRPHSSCGEWGSHLSCAKWALHSL